MYQLLIPRPYSLSPKTDSSPEKLTSFQDFLNQNVWPSPEWRVNFETLQAAIELKSKIDAAEPGEVVLLSELQKNILQRLIVLPGIPINHTLALPAWTFMAAVMGIQVVPE